MTSYDLSEVLLDELGYADSPAFVRSVTWSNRRPIPGVDSAYFVQNVPVAYFSRLSDADPDRLRQLHQDVWNHSKAPLLYVVLPQEIHIYNGYAQPAETAEEFARGDSLLRHLEQLTDVETARQTIRAQLAWYDRLHLDTGAFWTTPDARRIRRESRADQQLLHAMDQVRRRLLNEGLANDLAYILLGRSILIRYLEDREVLTREEMAQLTDGEADSYRGALGDLNTTYLLFEHLSQRFNGDLFPVEKREYQAVQQEHLDSMCAFLDGQDLESGQLRFWPYDFRYIPIELISGIYDTFLNSDERQEAGTYYTPLSLVDFILDQTLPPETICPDTTILDPACGSGVFLVRAYQRLVAAWQQQFGEPPTAQQLGEILKKYVFGVDINPSAIRIAAFNLYLAMLDYLEDQAIRKADFRFPLLMETNLIVSDFTDPSVRERLAGRRFDRVIGNPPWGRGTLTPEAAHRLKERDFTVGGKQIVQAFLADAPEFCTDSGEVALLAPAKSTILVTSGRHVAFRQQFFERYNVETVVNFSALVYELFDETLSPAVALFYRHSLPKPDDRIVYGVPKPSPLSRQLGAIVVDPTEIKHLDREELLAHPWLWKVALWGTPRDAAFIERLQNLPTLEQQARRLAWKVKEGIIKQIKGKGGKSAPWLQGKLFLPIRKFQPYSPDLDTCEPIREPIFHRPRTPDIFRGPLALLRHGLTIEGRCVAAFSNRDIVYTNKVTGVAGQSGHEVLLKWLVAYVNSPLAQYYHFLTSTSWAVERSVLLHGEYLRMPFLVPDEKDPRLLEILAYFDQIVALLQKRDVLDEAKRQHDIWQREEAIAELVFDIYDLTSTERQLVQDTLDYGIEFFYWSKQKQRKFGGIKAVQHPDTGMLKAYADTFIETVTALLRYQGQTLNALVYQDGTPLSVIGFELVSLTDAKETQIVESKNALREILRHLDQMLLERRTQALYMRRHVRIYAGTWLYLVRPSKRRFWTRSQARVDADSIVVEWLSCQQQIQG
jgi:methylase of polypeptide subunit release factors